MAGKQLHAVEKPESENRTAGILWNRNPEKECTELLAAGRKMEQFGIQLTKEQIRSLILRKNESLKKHRRVEFGKGILEQLLFTFMDSQYIDQENCMEVMAQLQDIFYQFKNETQDRITDEELLDCMKEQFETVCAGDTGYLADTCMERIARRLRETGRPGSIKGIYAQVDEEQRWDAELYYQTLHELI